jgi:Spy/CpxP family protein refolding chaperone
VRKKAVALVALIFLVLFSAEISAARGSRHFGGARSGHLGGSVRQPGGFHKSVGRHGSHLSPGSHRIHRHHFGDRQHFHHKNIFVPHGIFGHRQVIVPRRGLHSGFFFGPRVIGARPSSVVIWSHPGAISDYTPPAPARILDGDTVLERPLITIMLRHRDELSLSPQQVQDLENLREGYEREAIRYEADIRIAEMDLQRLLKTEPVDLEQVKVKLQEIEHQKTQIRLARIQTIEQEKSLLSPEQYEKLQSLLGESRRSQLEVPGGR